MSLALIAALIEAGVQIEPEVLATFRKIFSHKSPKMAARIASDAIDDTDTNNPASPYFVP